LSDAYDRMGVRLAGAILRLRDVLSIPSEPVLRGSIQVAADGVATVLLADHQTTGGYPKIATIISADLDQFAQLRAGDSVRFVPVEPSDAIAAARARAEIDAAYFNLISRPGRTLAHRLSGENLIDGAVSVDDEHHD
jgi:allophanate hydrolase subunit 2